VAQFLGDELGGVGVDHARLLDRRHLALLHQILMTSPRGSDHPVGEFLDGDLFRDRHLTNQLFFRLVALSEGRADAGCGNEASEQLAHSSALMAVPASSPGAARAARSRSWLRGSELCGGAARTHAPAGTAPESSGLRLLPLRPRVVRPDGRPFLPSPSASWQTSSAFFLVTSSCLAGSSSSLLLASAASRSFFSMAFALAGGSRISSAIFAFLGLAQAGIADAVCAAVALFIGRVRITTPGRLGRGGAGAVLPHALQRRVVRPVLAAVLRAPRRLATGCGPQDRGLGLAVRRQWCGAS